ncbi:MAG: T9SS type A sorting domain-containing protein [Flavobacteriales bacterium]|nr:MAG: T9SS type A sorting domain-containing protein [Flavobacteriales bacterium]
MLRGSAGCFTVFVGALAMGQGFNRRYDAFYQQRPQDAWGIERTAQGYTVISGSYDADSISPDSSFFHVTTLFTFLDGSGTKLSEHRNFRAWRGTFPGWANCCDTVPGGGYAVGGGVQSIDQVNEICLQRISPQGDTLWTRVFGGPNQYWIGRQVKRTPDGGFLIVGDTDANGNVDAFALKTDSLGNEQWRETYSGGSLSDYFLAVDLAADGDLFLGGQRRLTANDRDFWVHRVDSTGTTEWQRSWGGAFDEFSGHLVSLADGHVLVASGWCYSNNSDTYRPYLAKLDSANGQTLWEREYGHIAFTTTFFAAKERPNGDIIACGVSYAGGNQQGLLLRTTSQGDSIWMRTYYYQDTLITTGQGRFYDVLPTPDGGFIAAGSAYNPAGAPYPPGYSQDTWVVKVDSMGCIVPGCDGVGVQELVTNLGGALSVFPNPAHGSTTVQVQLPASMQRSGLRLVLVNAQGQVVLEQAAQDGANTLDLSALSGGLYYVHLASGTTWLSGTKLILE